MSSGTMIWLWISPLTSPSRIHKQVIRRDAEHRRAETAERIEGDDGPLGRDFVREAIDEVHFGRDRPCATGRDCP